MEGEQAQARVHQTVHSLTSMCWDKCVLPSPGVASLTFVSELAADASPVLSRPASPAASGAVWTIVSTDS